MSHAGSSASSSAGGSSSNGEEDDRYFSSFVDEFAARYGAWIKEENVPHTSEGYKENLEKSQTSTCARISALHYQTELRHYMLRGVDLDDVCGIDSHMFECKWVDTSDYRLCFHVNFSAWVKEKGMNEEDEDNGDDDSDEDEDDDEEDEDNGDDDSDEDEDEDDEEEDNGKPTTRIKRFFFAELLGTNDDGPQFVTSCVSFRDEMRDFFVKNCKFCTGMWHPVGGGFRGSK